MKNQWLLLTGTAMLFMAASCQNKQTEQTQSTNLAADSAAQTNAKPAAEPVAANMPAASTFDITRIPVSNADLGTFPYLSNLKNYTSKGYDSLFAEFDRFLFFDGSQFVPVEGRVHKRTVYAKDDSQAGSELMIRRNYEDFVKKMGGVKIYEGKIPAEAIEQVRNDLAQYNHGDVYNDRTTTFVIRQPGKEVWIQLVSNEFGRGYSLGIVEKGGMEQQITIVKADEIKRELDSKGKAVLYINFDTDKAILLPEGQQAVNEITAVLTQDAGLKLSVEGHTDNTGTATRNQQLSTDRANAVVNALVAAGIDKSRLKAVGYGAEKPLADNSTEEGKASNRRVELVKM